MENRGRGHGKEQGERQLVEKYAGERIGEAASKTAWYVGEPSSAVLEVALEVVKEAFSHNIPEAIENTLRERIESSQAWEAVDTVGDGLWEEVRRSRGEKAWDGIGVIGLASAVASGQSGYLTVADLLDFKSPWEPLVDIWRMGCWPVSKCLVFYVLTP